MVFWTIWGHWKQVGFSGSFQSTIITILFRGSGGKPFGEGEQGKWYVLGAAAAVAFLATITMWEMGYKEIAWKDFVYKYVLCHFTAVCQT